MCEQKQIKHFPVHTLTSYSTCPSQQNTSLLDSYAKGDANDKHSRLFLLWRSPSLDAAKTEGEETRIVIIYSGP